MAKSELLQATKSFKFGGTRVFPGDDIDATPQEAKLLFALKRVTRRPDGQRQVAALLSAPVTPPAPPAEPPAAPPAAAEPVAEAAAEPAATEAAAAELPAAAAELPAEPVVETPPAGTGEGAAAAAAAAKPTRQRRTAA